MSEKKECPQCKFQNEPKSLSCTFCGYIFGSKKRKRTNSTLYRNAPLEKSWTQESQRLGPGGSSSRAGIDGTNLSWAENQNLGWANLGEGNGSADDVGGIKPGEKYVVPETQAEIIGKCAKCGQNLYDTSYQPEAMKFISENKIKDNFHKYIKKGVFLLCPRCFNIKLAQLASRKDMD